jgi:hypothetical protein
MDHESRISHELSSDFIGPKVVTGLSTSLHFWTLHGSVPKLYPATAVLAVSATTDLSAISLFFRFVKSGEAIAFWRTEIARFRPAQIHDQLLKH